MRAPQAALEGPNGWEPLNENYGIFFARVAETPDEAGTVEEIIRSLRHPHLFGLAVSDGVNRPAARGPVLTGAAAAHPPAGIVDARHPDLQPPSTRGTTPSRRVPTSSSGTAACS
ncbi:hypothetical protein [Tessaracoccus defluvii]|uniref:Uncharacterized protein n=1 Tax=Tessaracoccus defluvii TaxID=1285901 RepID=A0A7H0H4S9_9ACTN|nr:hypothetical protein [Tessaracoccus defluvii]QNP55545.1 hypothetical protein H9L22_15395 [Tessaracoccus defluvii]